MGDKKIALLFVTLFLFNRLSKKPKIFGKIMEGEQYWKPMDELFYNYKNHPESKFEGNIGVLDRRDLFARSTLYIGKESNNLDESMVFGVQENNYTCYLDDKTKHMKKQDMEEFILHLSTKVARNYKISERRLRDWQKRIEDKIRFDISKRNLKKLYRIKRIEDEPRSILKYKKPSAII